MTERTYSRRPKRQQSKYRKFVNVDGNRNEIISERKITNKENQENYNIRFVKKVRTVRNTV